MTRETILVLYGGVSKEREVSFASGVAVINALQRLNYGVIAMEANRDVLYNIDAMLKNLRSTKGVRPDLVFIALHGGYGENGSIQGALDIIGIPYTHSGMLPSAIAMNKVFSRQFMKILNIEIAKGVALDGETLMAEMQLLPYPYVVKPVNGGSSVGVYVINSSEDYENMIANANFNEHSELLLEEHIDGVELQTAVLMDKALGTIEVRPKGRFYDYQSKYCEGMAEHVYPAEVPQHVYERTMEWAEKLHRALGCKNISRSDFLYDPKNDRLCMLELNTHPGFTPLSLLPEIALKSQQIDFELLVEIIVRDGLKDIYNVSTRSKKANSHQGESETFEAGDFGGCIM